MIRQSPIRSEATSKLIISLQFPFKKGLLVGYSGLVLQGNMVFFGFLSRKEMIDEDHGTPEQVSQAQL